MATTEIGKILANWQAVSGWLEGHSVRIGMALAFGLLLVACFYGLKLVGKRLEMRTGQWTVLPGRALAAMRLWFMIALATEIVAQFGEAPAVIAGPIHTVFIIALALQSAMVLRQLILGALELRASEPEAPEALGNAFGLIRITVTVTLFTIAAILILANVGVNVTGLIAGLGIGGIAIGLAAQGIFADLFAALSILLDKPFQVGDTIAFETFSGTVDAIGLKSTRLRAASGEEIIVSNTHLLAKVVRNQSRMEVRRVTQTLSVTQQTPPERIAALPDLLRAAIAQVPGCNFLRCGLDGFAPSSLDLQIIYAVETEDNEQLALRRQAVNLILLRLLAGNGIALAMPSQTSFTAAPDGTLIMPYPATG